MIEVYTDGAYSSSRKQGGVGLVFLKDNKKISEFSKMYKNTTNNRMELIAILIALQSTKEELIIYSDSMYCIGCATLNWKRNKNVDLWKKYDILSKNRNIQFKHIKGHQSNKWNNYVDKLAVAASQTIQPL